MEQRQNTTLRRACEGTLIPPGEQTPITAGTPVTITQSLGGAYTVVAGSHLVRIDGKDADALGLTSDAAPKDGAAPAAAGPVDEAMVWTQLKTCYDPEIPVNIVELGLIYDLSITPHPAGGSVVEVKMTLTTPGCGMGAMIADDAQHKVLAIPGVAEAKIALVWDPPWSSAMMSEAAKLHLGLM
ncbi:MAG: putative Fe-S cluster assembly protein SufT [Verrucomicrobia bacterium]|nr:putative Fe-S cluster assembly protein SufT [Verrucomicrobiota bacterium]